jgi:hypothetical protein
MTTVMATRPTIHYPAEREVQRGREAGGGCGSSVNGGGTVIFRKYRSVSNESRMEAGRGIKCCCFSGSFGRGIDDISIGYVAKFQVWRWTLEYRSPDNGMMLSYGCVYARKTCSAKIEGSRKLKRSHTR